MKKATGFFGWLVNERNELTAYPALFILFIIYLLLPVVFIEQKR